MIDKDKNLTNKSSTSVTCFVLIFQDMFPIHILFLSCIFDRFRIKILTDWYNLGPMLNAFRIIGIDPSWLRIVLRPDSAWSLTIREYSAPGLHRTEHSRSVKRLSTRRYTIPHTGTNCLFGWPINPKQYQQICSSAGTDRSRDSAVQTEVPRPFCRDAARSFPESAAGRHISLRARNAENLIATWSTNGRLRDAIRCLCVRCSYL